MSSKVIIDGERVVGAIDPKLFGGFLEHLGRAIYEGIYEPGSSLTDARGFRKDTLAALRDLGATIIRYPGGNFLSGYHWQDGVGPKDQRPVRREMAWMSIEPNQFGTNEFIEYCRELGTEPMLGVNLGTGSIEEAGAWVEYCNAPAGSYYADLRVRHGYAQPHNVKYWCLGNEMDGPWQIGHLEADEYARKAREAAKVMHWQDPSLKLILCGSSGPGMKTFPEWDRTSLEACWDQVDYLSLHHYTSNEVEDTPSYLARAFDFEAHIDTLSATLGYVKAKLRSKHDVYLSWDEWNVWYRARGGDGGWARAPHLLEEVYNLEDALVVAQWMNVFLRRSQVLKIACLAQLVNVIAPILVRPDGLIKQSIYYPFQLFRQHASGVSLDALVKCPTYATQGYGDVPVLDVSASFDAASGKWAAFVVNRRMNASEPVEFDLRGLGADAALVQVVQVSGSDPKAANSFDQPYAVAPANLGARTLQDGKLTLTLPPLSFTTIHN
jgi:alpha-L-arabinofuranosidase